MGHDEPTVAGTSQIRGGRTRARAALQLQRSAGNRATSRLLQRSTATAYVHFSVAVDRPMSSRELLIEFAMQTRRAEHLTREQAEAGIDAGEIYWVDDAGDRIGLDDPGAPTVSADEAERRYKLLTVFAHGITPLSDPALEQARKEFYTLGDSAQTEINRQTNELFWGTTGYKFGQKLDPQHDAHDALLAQDWLRIRAHVVGQRRRYLAQPTDLSRVLYEMIPEDSRQFMFVPGGTAKLTPTDFDTALSVAQRIAAMTPAEREQYWARVQGTTTSWTAFEHSLERFASESTLQAGAAAAREEAVGNLAGYEDLYFAYTAYNDKWESESRKRGGPGPMDKEYEALRAAMQRHSFETVFEVLDFLQPHIAAFRSAFEAEGLLVGDEMLDRFRHLLWSETERLLDGTQLAEFHGAIKGAAELESLADTYPLLRDEELRDRLEGVYRPGNTFDRVRFYAKQRRESIWQAEQELHGNHDLIYPFDVLRETALKKAGAGPGSMYRDIVMRRKDEIDEAQFLKSLGFAILSIAAAILSRGGTLGVIGAGVAVGVGTWETLDEFRDYEVGVAGHDAGLQSDDPSAFWVILSAMGALGDAAAAVKVLSALGDAGRGLDEAADLPRFKAAYDDRLAAARRAGDGETARALEEARAAIFATAEKRVAKTADDVADDPAIELRLATDTDDAVLDAEFARLRGRYTDDVLKPYEPQLAAARAIADPVARRAASARVEVHAFCDQMAVRTGRGSNLNKDLAGISDALQAGKVASTPEVKEFERVFEAVRDAVQDPDQISAAITEVMQLAARAGISPEEALKRRVGGRVGLQSIDDLETSTEQFRMIIARPQAFIDPTFKSDRHGQYTHMFQELIVERILGRGGGSGFRRLVASLPDEPQVNGAPFWSAAWDGLFDTDVAARVITSPEWLGPVIHTLLDLPGPGISTVTRGGS